MRPLRDVRIIRSIQPVNEEHARLPEFTWTAEICTGELHHEGLDAVSVFQSVDGGDVWMVQGGEDFRFALKSSEPIVVSGK
jgi:hypothetical protein